jgi:hypothetical protein
MDAAKGIAGSAFSAIAGAFKPLQAGIPQDLTAINLKNATDQLAADTKTATAPIVSSINSNLSAAGVDLTTGRIPSVDAAFASGGIGAGIQAFTGGTLSSLNASSIASGISNLPGGQNAIASVTNSTTGVLSGVTASLAGVGAIASNLSTGVLNGISSASASLSSSASLLTGSALTGAGSSLSGALSNPAAALSGIGASISGAVSSVGSSVTGILSGAGSSLTGAALSNPSAALSSIGSSLSGALSGAGSLNIPGLPSLNSLTQGLQSGKLGLASLASAGLSASAAAALTASINSLSKASPFPIKMPSVAIGTVDRSELSSQISSLLGDSKIPSPNFSGTGPAPDAVAAQAQSAKNKEKYSMLKYSLDKAERDQSKKIDEAQATFVQARNTYPAGDSKIGQAKYDWEVEIIAQSELRTENIKRLETARQELNIDYSGNPILG